MRRMSFLRMLPRLIGFGLLAAAVVQEMRKPAPARTWNGKVAGFVPYDLRLPTLHRLRDAYYNPTNSSLFTPQPFGVGWTINFATVYRFLRGLSERATEGQRPPGR